MGKHRDGAQGGYCGQNKARQRAVAAVERPHLTNSLMADRCWGRPYHILGAGVAHFPAALAQESQLC